MTEVKKTYQITLTEDQCSALASVCTKYFEAMTREKKFIPPSIADHVMQALQAMKSSVEGKPILTRTNS